MNPEITVPDASTPSDPVATPPEELLDCDVVMKGGIASGVIYPHLVAELATRYRFKNIGGTSAGAIAAVAAAAAECGRHNNPGTGSFDKLKKLPQELGQNAPGSDDSVLFNLFQPSPRTRPFFRLLKAALKGKDGFSKAAGMVGAAIRSFPLTALLGLVPGLLLLLTIVSLLDWQWSLLDTMLVSGGILALMLLTLVWSGPRENPVPIVVVILLFWVLIVVLLYGVSNILIGLLHGLAAFLFLLLSLTVMLAAVVGRFAFAFGKTIPDHYFGLCTGLTTGHQDPNGPEALTPWLHKKINEFAGKNPQGDPLTFGDLWDWWPDHPDIEKGDPLIPPPNQRRTNLAMMTTCVTLGRPYRLPFDNNLFYFDPEEFEEFFPKNVVTWMVDHPRPSKNNTDAQFDGRPLARLPLPAYLPVLVATRMSLSFPLLLSAVPLYATDFSRKANQNLPAGERYQAERCWFSDGGIASNFPIHFFDQPFPAWPTFGINLRPYHPDHLTREIYRPSRNVGGILEWFTHFDKGGGLGAVARFLGSIMTTMQNWQDNTQARVPGYRDRIVHISQSDDEGGMNLNMAPKVIEDLAGRGRSAAEKLIEDFARQPSGSKDNAWENHRWVRFRSTMALFEQALLQNMTGYQDPPHPTLEDLTQRPAKMPPTSYRPTSSQQQQMVRLMRYLGALAKWWEKHPSFSEGAPKPEAELRITPKI